MNVRKHFFSSILLWVRTDQPRGTGMDCWRGPHSKIISATPGLEEYRQIHLAEVNPGLWPAIPGVETDIPVERKIDGVAEVTFRSPLSPLLGCKQTRLAYRDEINVFRRTLLYAGLPKLVPLVRGGGARREGGRPSPHLPQAEGWRRCRRLPKLINKELVPALAGTGVLREPRTQTFLSWIEKLWDTPNVAHDNPADQRFHASLVLASRTRRSGRASSTAVRSRACRTRWLGSLRPYTPTTCPRR